MRKFGFKVFSSNLQTIPTLFEECGQFARTKPDVFLELMTVPTSTMEDFKTIKQYLKDVEVRIHAPHSAMGFDAGNKELEKQNQKFLAVAQKAADLFQAPTIVVHAGCGHGSSYLEETVRQFKGFKDERIVVENLPDHNSHQLPLHGNTPEEISYIMHETGCGFCFDFSHAVCAALHLKIDPETQLKGFYALNPTVYHLCDGDITTPKDLHKHFGTGNYPLGHFLNDLTDPDAYITMETGTKPSPHNDPLIRDYEYLKSILKA